MPIPEPVTPWEPWQTAWPAGVAVVGLVLSSWRARAHLRPARADWPWMVAVGVLALAIRLWVLPALSLHEFDGHEAEYWDIFRGTRAVNRGGTVLYPSMQWMWWGLGRILPHHPAVPVCVMAVMGSVGCVIVAAAIGRWTGRIGAAVAGCILSLHPVLGAWSSSAYNVVLPWCCSAVVVWCASGLAGRRSPPLPLVWMAVFAGVLVVATRMEAAWIAVPALVVALLDAPEGQPRLRRIRRCVGWLVPLALGGALAAAAIFPLVFPGEVPGAGERGLSFSINWAWSAPYAPLDSTPALGIVLALVGLGLRARPFPVAIFSLSALLAHLLLASFDDFGDRHTLGALFALALATGAAVSGSGRGTGLARGLALGVVILCVQGLSDMRDRFYGSEERFADVLREDAQWSSLPRITATEARADCGWVAEDPRVAPQPQKSHFNLLDPNEAESLRSATGCLRWCLDVQDWRWSSRGVRDRALRTARLYRLRPVAVVEDLASGYACLVLELGPRRVGASEIPSAAQLNEEYDASGSLPYSRIP